MKTKKVISQLLDIGWSVYPLLDPTPLYEARESILLLVRELTGHSTITLENYHEYLDDDEKHFAVQKAIATHARKQEFAKKILLGQLPLYQAILGPDISISTSTIWRIARPNKPQDNIGFHRDIEVGQSPFMITLWFPLVDVDEESCMKLMPGSHRMSREQFPYYKTDNPAVERGSEMNRLGFMWAPHVYDPWFEAEMSPVPLTVGQGLMFLTPVMHGTRINSGSTTRWSTDFRIANSFSFAPINWFHHSDEPQFEIVSESPAIKIGQLFYDFSSKSS